jgi:hypothetical protein
LVSKIGVQPIQIAASAQGTVQFVFPPINATQPITIALTAYTSQELTLVEQLITITPYEGVTTTIESDVW